MALYEEDILTVDITTELKIMLLMHIENIDIEDALPGGATAFLTEKGVVFSSAVQSLALHKSLYRFMNEVYQAGVDSVLSGPSS